jgi:hypothetical protein
MKYPLVTITWHDALATSGWKTADAAKQWARENSWVVKERGYLLEKCREYILLGIGYEESKGYFRHVVKIPNGMIRK